MDLGDLLSGLTQEDMENLQEAASQLFGNGGNESEGENESENNGGGIPDLGSLLGNTELLGKLGTVMGAMNRRDPRSDLITALKPLLSEKRRKKADEAAQIVKLLDLIPLFEKGK